MKDEMVEQAKERKGGGQRERKQKRWELEGGKPNIDR